MAHNFIDEEEKVQRLGYTDGFRFGFGFFIAALLGTTIVTGLVLLVHYAMTR
jgi:hypothetical protein